ncbi:MAG: N-acetyltransferase, partial [Betaproteobacteria bacterium]|nr:N-acetyltransferase [Betaproteobacteria bacterium]
MAYGEILETLGYALLPVIEKFADVITTKVLPQLEAWIAANKDKLAASLDTILTKLPALIIQVFDLFDFIQRNLKTIEVLGALLVSTFAAAKVYAGVIALSGAINILTAAFGRQAVAATAAGTATAFATGGASALAAAAALVVFTTASLVAYKQLTKNNKVLDQTKEVTADIAKDYNKVVVTTGKVLGNTTKLTAEQITLRPSEPEDISLFYIWENDTEHWNSTNLTTPISKSALMDLVYNTHNDIFIDRQLRFVIAHKAENEPLGTIDLYDFDPKSMRCGIGIYIGAAHRRKGIAKHALRLAKSFAFNQLHVHQ